MSKQRDPILATMTPGQRIATARAAAGRRMPYFNGGIQSLVPIEADVPTMAVRPVKPKAK